MDEKELKEREEVERELSLLLQKTFELEGELNKIVL